jgi:2-polyprenyl-3-methyl-5-hydroxy-6-metoxy-1,4-benzoquinol methylase
VLNDEVRSIWNTNAEFWDARMGEGNAFHKTLIEPTQLRLLDIKSGQHILDVACGNGQFARKMVGLRAKVTAIDFSEKFIAIARSKSSPEIDYRVIDATSVVDLNKLSGMTFDSVVCTMALMDMENIDVLIGCLPRWLKKNGKFVFSVLHPCFNSGEFVLVYERDESGTEITDRYSVKVSKYLVEKSSLGLGMIGQPKPQYYFHRPISNLLNTCFEAGFVLDAFEEPSFSGNDTGHFHNDDFFTHIPAVLICRLKLV